MNKMQYDLPVAVSPDCRVFLQQLIEYEQTKRPTAREALKLSYLTENATKPSDSSSRTVKNLPLSPPVATRKSDFKPMKVLHKVATDTVV